MKKWLTVLIASLLVLALSACNSSSENTKSGSSGDLSLEDVYKKALDRQSEIKSTSADMKMDVKMSTEENGEPLEFSTGIDMKMDMTLEPLAMSFNGKAKMGGFLEELTGEDVEMEMAMEGYVSGDTMYMYESDSKTWIKMPLENMNEILQATNLSSIEQYKELEPFIKDFKMTEEEDGYVLTLETDSDKFAEYINKKMDLLGTLEDLADEEMLKNIKYDKVSYVLKVKKDTFDITATDVVINMSYEVEGVKTSIESSIKVTLSNFNGVEEIKVPQEVIDKAVDFEE